MKLYVIQKRDNYYAYTLPRGSLVFSEHLKNAHIFGEDDRAEAEWFAQQHGCKLVELNCTATVVMDAEEET